ncbi:MAG: ATP-binding cassette domain-containing protein [Sphingomicrobium sp.]
MSFEVDVSRRLGERALKFNFQAGSGLTVLFGPSGSGKTSILNMVAGLLTPDRGRIAVTGSTLFDSAAKIDVAPDRRAIGYVFQDERLFPHMRVRNNLLYGLKLVPASRRWMAYDEAVEFLGIGHLADRWPGSLSGGEKQRVAVGRALLAGARVLLMDEPMASLDQPRREEIMQVIERVRDTLKLPILYVTHDRDEARRLGSQTIAL